MTHACRAFVAAFALGCVVAGAGVGVSVRGDDSVVDEINRMGGGTVFQVGSTSGGERIRGVRIGRGGTETRPGVLLIGGFDAMDAFGSSVVAGLARHLSERVDEIDAFERFDVYVIPMVNRDGLTRVAAAGVRGADSGTVLPIDDDRDGRVDEDPPMDLDGDGFITQMRVRSPRLATGLRATHVVDSDDARLVREAGDGESPERAVFAMLTESRDLDGDGSFGEDGLLGPDLRHNFPYRWPEFEDKAGRYPLSIPECRSLVDWMLDHPQIVCVLSFGERDTVSKLPKVGKFDQSGRVPLGIEEGDKAVWESVIEMFEASVDHVSGGHDEFGRGGFTGWSYADFGVYAFDVPVWVRPDVVPSADDAGGEGEEESEGDGEDGEPLWKKPDGVSEDAAWLSYFETVVGNTDVYRAWRAFDHPELGEVEIGGWVAGAWRPGSWVDVADVVVEQGAFVEALLGALGSVEIGEPEVASLGGGVHRVALELRNVGSMPTRSASGVKARRVPPVSMVVDGGRLVSGDAVVRFDRIDGRSSVVGEWVVRGSESFEIEVRSPVFGRRGVVVEFE